MTERARFVRVAGAGIAFQGGSAAVDSATIMSGLVHQLTGNAVLVGAVTAILRIGWLSPQLFVGFLAQRDLSSRRYYAVGAYGRAGCIALLAGVLAIGAAWPSGALGLAVMGLWTAYAFVSGIVAVPYNDMVARAVPSESRSRLLAIRFLGGGLLGLGVATAADRLLAALAFPIAYAAVFGLAAALMAISATVFMAMGEPPAGPPPKPVPTFWVYLREGRRVFREDRRFRLFVYAQWCGGGVLMALPFYVVFATGQGFDLSRVGVLLGAQTAGALISNSLWGWWGDVLGKASLLRGVVVGRLIPPLAVLALITFPEHGGAGAIWPVATIFFVLGALANGLTIAVVGYLMEISPDEMRPAYSGYFNALTAPAYLAPLIGGALADLSGLGSVFAISAIAAAGQVWFVQGVMMAPDGRRG